MDQALRVIRRTAAETGDWTPYVQALERALGLDGEADQIEIGEAPATEESGVHKEWLKAARDGVDSLDEFSAQLGKVQHDYGTVCHALAAVALAGAYKANRDWAGITGFQSGFVMWSFVQEWTGMRGPAQLLRFEEMLYPQYGRDEKFSRTLTPETAKWLREEAQKRVNDGHSAHPDVIAHWKRLAAGEIPFGWRVREA